MIKYTKAFDGLTKRINLEDSDRYASLTHFLQNQGSHQAEPFKESGFNTLINDEILRERILNGSIAAEDANQLTLDIEYDVPFPPSVNPSFSFIDLFAGVGGFRLALQSLNGKCVFSSEIDKYCKKTYEANFGEIPFGDIKKFTNLNGIGDNIEKLSGDENKGYVKKINEHIDKLIPDHDILTGGFPCQAFSIAGRRGGFEDTRGTLFFDVAKIIRAKKPKAFILENVKGLRSHKRGDTLAIILETLRKELNYFVPDPEVLNAKEFGVPQNRERIIIVGFREDLGVQDFIYPEENIEGSKFVRGIMFSSALEENAVSPKYYISDVYLNTLKKHRKRHENKGNGFGYQIIAKDETANAIVVGGMGRERNLVIDHRQKDLVPVTNIKGSINTDGIRKMTPREWARLQGFPDTYNIDVVSDTQSYKQFGNSVAVPVIQAVGQNVKQKIT